jgi:hypothetical protein
MRQQLRSNLAGTSEFACPSEQHRRVAPHPYQQCTVNRGVYRTVTHDRPNLEFLERRKDLIGGRCDGEFVWPKDRPFNAFTAQVAAPLPRWMLRLVDLAVVVA